jgi:hypothetical protein
MSDCVSMWFAQWMVYHQSLHPDRRWVDPSSGAGFDFYQGWIEAFEEVGATEELARQASRKLQARKFYFNEHLARVVEVIGDRKRSQSVASASSPASLPHPELVAASLRSRHCLRCQGSGWELRRFLWHEQPRPFTVQVACSCEAGRWRKAHGHDPDPEPQFDGLWRYMAPEEPAPEPLQPNAFARRMALKADTSQPPVPIEVPHDLDQVPSSDQK